MARAKKEPAKKAGKEVATTGSKAVGEVMPDFMSGHENRGTENIDASDMTIPRLQLLQGLSGAVQEGNGVSGEFWHTALEQSFGDSVDIVPLFVRKSYLLWNPLNDGGGVLARADDAIHWSPANTVFEVHPSKDDPRMVVKWETKDTVRQSGLDKFGTSFPNNPESPPAASLMYDVVAAMPSHPEVGMAVFSMQKSAIPAAKLFNSKLNASSVPTYGRIFTLGVKTGSSGAHEYFLPTFTANGLVTDEAMFAEYARQYDVLVKEGIRVKDEDQEGDAPVGGEAV